jgi:hypothetical protein
MHAASRVASLSHAAKKVERLQSSRSSSSSREFKQTESLKKQKLVGPLKNPVELQEVQNEKKSSKKTIKKPCLVDF